MNFDDVSEFEIPEKSNNQPQTEWCEVSGYSLENNDLHCAGLGHYLMGKSYADAILTILK